jgi:hypothetical protein
MLKSPPSTEGAGGMEILSGKGPPLELESRMRTAAQSPGPEIQAERVREDAIPALSAAAAFQ